MRIALILGAGASLANALHFRPQRMSHTRPPLDTTFFEVVQTRNIQLSPALRSYFRTLTRSDLSPDRVRKLRMEELFKDLYFDFQESPESGRLRSAYTDLIYLYQRVLRETTNWLCSRRGGPVGRLIADAADRASHLSVITFNHDLVIENEIHRRARLRARWCLDRGYGSFGEDLLTLVPTPSGRTSVFPLHEDGLCSHAQPLEVLKLHGSLNWFVRLSGSQPTARTLSGEAGARDVYLLNSQLAADNPRYRRQTRGARGRREWDLWPVIIPPIYAKRALRRRVQQAWDDAQNALREAERVVFFGYSLPLIDIDAEKLFERALAENANLKWADVINPAPESAQRYAGLAPAVPIRWYPTLSSFMDAGGLG